MKKAIFSLFGAVAMMVFLLPQSVHAQNQLNENALIGRAHSAPGIGACVGQANGSQNGNGNSQVNTTYEASVSVTGSCFVSGFTRRVTFVQWIMPNGPACVEIDGEIICHPIDPVGIVIAYVDFDCQDNIIGWECLR